MDPPRAYRDQPRIALAGARDRERDVMPSSLETLPPSVTVVDDEPYIQDILTRAARSWHYHCQTADSAEQALQLLETRLTPVVVTDLRMPGHGGVWLVRQIRQR